MRRKRGRGDGDRTEELVARLASLEQARLEMSHSMEGHAAWLADVQRWLTSTVETVASISSLPPTFSAGLARGPARLADPVEALARQLQIWVVGKWLAQADVPEGPRVSVVMPTRNRRRLLERAVGTVLAQSYANWELLIVDDASDDDTPEFLAGVSDPRIRALTAPGGSATRARNVALAAASGELVAHLDDDNLMSRDWLKGVAWAFTRWPEADVLYGARIIEDAHTGLTPGAAFPSIEFFPYDRARLEVANFIDTNVIAHRAGLPEARFDEGLSRFDDWDLCLRLTGYKDPLELPVIACSYLVGAPNRMSEDGHHQDQIRRINARAHTSRTLRLLVLDPSAREGVDELVRSLRGEGAHVDTSANLEDVEERPPDLVLLDGRDGRPELIESIVARRLPFVVLGEPNSVASQKFCLGNRAQVDGSALQELSESLTRWRYEHA